VKRLLISIALVAGLIGLVWFSYRLAGNRIYQVDECQNIYTARLISSGQAKTSFAGITLFLAPLVWLTRNSVHSVDMFVSGRFFCLELFWLNIVLMAAATGEKLFSRRGLLALMGAATLAPLWDYGFEIRHDNLFLAGLLLMWCMLRVRPEGLRSYFIAGALAVALEFVAFKAFVYIIPISLGFLLFPPPEHKGTRVKLLAAWIIGAAVAFVVVRIGYGMAGIWDVYLRGFHEISKAAGGNSRFAPWNTLERLLSQTPLLLAVVIPGLLVVAADLVRRKKAALTWDSSLPEALLFLVALGALLVNPAPHPYNLLHLVPYAFIFAWRYLSPVLKIVADRALLYPAIGGIIVFAHLVPFWVATRRHSDYPNYHQEALMERAEDMTDPEKDPVYDGMGMVPTRRSIHYQWFLHSLNIQSFINGQEMPVRDMLAANPAAVIIPSYRTDWLPEKDHVFIRERYVPLEDDFLVLGKILPLGGGDIEIIRAGRYRITTAEASNIEGTYARPKSMPESNAPEPVFPPLAGTLDGMPLDGKPVELKVGKHHLECAAKAAVVWLGPHLDTIPRMNGWDHRWLFVNWY
jgi:hypothetical protein